jgi:hypothetical protein
MRQIHRLEELSNPRFCQVWCTQDIAKHSYIYQLASLVIIEQENIYTSSCRFRFFLSKHQIKFVINDKHRQVYFFGGTGLKPINVRHRDA